MGHTGRTWRLRAWPNDPSVAHLIFTDHMTVPSVADIELAVSAARADGAVAVRTSAMFPRAAAAAAAVGFDEIDRLALLGLRLDDGRRPAVPDAAHRIRPLRPWHTEQAAAVDHEAFGPLWGNDAASLTEIRRATPAHRARCIRVAGDLAGFAISGAGGDGGYIQRIAVANRHRRAGIARQLALDAIAWMVRRGSTSVLVNTGVSNTAALGLYEDIGFTARTEQLLIAEYRFAR